MSGVTTLRETTPPSPERTFRLDDLTLNQVRLINGWSGATNGAGDKPLNEASRALYDITEALLSFEGRGGDVSVKDASGIGYVTISVHEPSAAV